MSRYLDDDDVGYIGGGGTFRIPDRDVYRRTLTTFGSVHNFFKNHAVVRSFRDRRIQQPHFCSLKNITALLNSPAHSVDGVCSHFLRRGLIKPNKTQMTTAVWSTDARWLVLGTVTGEVALWEGDTLKVHKVVSLPAHKVFEGDEIVDSNPITAMTWNHDGTLLVSGDSSGLINYCDETFREVRKIPDAHSKPVRGLSFSPLDFKLVSCSDDGYLNVWARGAATPELTLEGHRADVKAVDWHPYRSLIASASRDCTVRLWDPHQKNSVSELNFHKKPVNCCTWNRNGNWLATGSRDGLVKLYDIRTMKEIETFRGHNSDICSMSWHPHNETLLSSGAYNGSIIYWQAMHTQAPHTIIADAHRQSIDIMAFHPAGHCLATASHDGILKFWCREPPGSKLDNEASKEFQDNPTVQYGPVKIGATSAIPLVQTTLTGPDRSGGHGHGFPQSQGYGGGGRGEMSSRPPRHGFGRGGPGGGRGEGGGGRGGDRKRPRDN